MYNNEETPLFFFSNFRKNLNFSFSLFSFFPPSICVFSSKIFGFSLFSFAVVKILRYYAQALVNDWPLGSSDKIIICTFNQENQAKITFFFFNEKIAFLVTKLATSQSQSTASGFIESFDFGIFAKEIIKK